jgi:hypothetical protein
VKHSTSTASRTESSAPAVDLAATSTRWPDPLDVAVSDCDGGADVDVEFSAPSVNVVSEAGTEVILGVGAGVRVGVDVTPPPAGG